MGKSIKSSSSEDEGSSPDVSSMEQDLDSLRVDVSSLKDDVASLTATVKSTLDMMPSKEELLAMVTSFQELAKKLAKIPSSSKHHHKKRRGEGEEHAIAKKEAKADTNSPIKESSSNVSNKESDILEKGTLKPVLLPCSSSDNRLEKTSEKRGEGEEPAIAKKEAKADTNSPLKESSSDVSNKESDILEKGTLKQVLLPCSSSDNRLEKTSEKSDEGEEPAKKKAKSDTNNTREKESITRPDVGFPVYLDAHPLHKHAQVGKRVEFKMQPGASYDGGLLFVKGYDSSLSEDDIAEAMLEHFSPCGMIRRIFFKTNGTTPILKHVFVEMLQGAEAALKLNGSDLGGFKLEVHDAKQRDEFYITYDLDFPFIPPQNPRRHELMDLDRRRRFTKERPPVYGIVSSRKINK